jgi:hypothetical protein
LSRANSSSARTTDSFVDVSLVSGGTSLNLGGVENSFNVLGDLAGDWGPTVIGTFELVMGFANDPGAAVEVVGAAASAVGAAATEYGRYIVDAGAGAIDSFVDTLNPVSPWVDIPNIGPVFGHEDAYFVGNVAGTIAGMAAGLSIGNIAAGNASLGDALAFLPVMTVGVQKLRGAPTNCFIAGTLVAVAGAGTSRADAGPSLASKPIEEIQVGDFVWARAEHDPSAPAVLQKVVALYRNTAHDLQTLDVVGELGSAEPLGQSVQIVATDEHPFYVVDVGWTMADAIQVGQKLVGAGGAVLTVVANQDWKPDGGVVVYNFQVEGDHTYFVGDIHAQGEWVWTHNSCSPLRAALIDKYGEKFMDGKQAAHIIPKNGWGWADEKLGAIIQKVTKAGLIDLAENGFPASSGHLGTHTREYVIQVIETMKNRQTRKQLLSGIKELRAMIEQGTFQ